jgi:hypothetical protein
LTEIIQPAANHAAFFYARPGVGWVVEEIGLDRATLHDD